MDKLSKAIQLSHGVGGEEKEIKKKSLRGFVHPSKAICALVRISFRYLKREEFRSLYL
jgi:hypothetical protein